MSKKSEKQNQTKKVLTPQERRKIERSHFLLDYEKSIKIDIEEAISSIKRKPTNSKPEKKPKPSIQQQIIALQPKTKQNEDQYIIPDSDAPHVSFNNPSFPTPKHASAIPKKSHRKRTGFSDSSGAIPDPIFDEEDEQRQKQIEQDKEQDHEEEENTENVQESENSEENQIENDTEQTQEEEDQEDSQEEPQNEENENSDGEEDFQPHKRYTNHTGFTSASAVPSSYFSSQNDGKPLHIHPKPLIKANISSDDPDDEPAETPEEEQESENANAEEQESENIFQNDDSNDDDDDDDGADILNTKQDDSSDEIYVVEAVTDTRKNEIRNHRKQRNVYDY